MILRVCGNCEPSVKFILRHIKTAREQRRAEPKIQRVRLNATQTAEESARIAYEDAQADRRQERREKGDAERAQMHQRAFAAVSEKMRVAGNE